MKIDLLLHKFGQRKKQENNLRMVKAANPLLFQVESWFPPELIPLTPWLPCQLFLCQDCPAGPHLRSHRLGMTDFLQPCALRDCLQNGGLLSAAAWRTLQHVHQVCDEGCSQSAATSSGQGDGGLAAQSAGEGWRCGRNVVLQAPVQEQKQPAYRRGLLAAKAALHKLSLWSPFARKSAFLKSIGHITFDWSAIWTNDAQEKSH